MKKFYVAPEMEVEMLAIEAAIIATSGLEGNPGGGDLPNAPF